MALSLVVSTSSDLKISQMSSRGILFFDVTTHISLLLPEPADLIISTTRSITLIVF